MDVSNLLKRLVFKIIYIFKKRVKYSFFLKYKLNIEVFSKKFRISN